MLYCIIILCALTSAEAGIAKIDPSPTPHIIIFVADDLGWNDVGYHGSEILTPNIDHLAYDGVRLESYYVQPMCTPSRAALMTGRYPIHTGLQHEVIYAGQRSGLPLEMRTLANELKDRGYATHGVGKWHLGFYKKEYLPVQRGFDSWLGYLTGNEDYYTKVNCEQLGCGYDFYRDNNLDFIDNGTYSTLRFTERAQEIIEGHDPSQPLFLYVPYQAVHFPLEVPEHYEAPYSFINDRNRRIFAGMASCMDESIGNITQSLKDAGMWDNSVIIFSTDNGGETNAGGNNWPLRGKKWTLWEGGVHGAAFVHSPLLSSRAGSRHQSLMHISDWLPTLIEGVLGDELQENTTLDGVNMWDSIRLGTAGSRTEVLHNIDPLSPHPGKPKYNGTFPTNFTAAIRVGDWKLLTGNPGDGRWYPVPTVQQSSRHTDWLAAKMQSSGLQQGALYEYDMVYHGSKAGVPRGAQFNGYDPQRWANVAMSSKNVWLFNITADPEEVIDVSSQFPSVVKLLLDRLQYYQQTAVKPNFPSIDKAAEPTRHNGCWVPWVDNSFFLTDLISTVFGKAQSFFATMF